LSNLQTQSDYPLSFDPRQRLAIYSRAHIPNPAIITLILFDANGELLSFYHHVAPRCSGQLTPIY
jgi:hypothetical protein